MAAALLKHKSKSNETTSPHTKGVSNANSKAYCPRATSKPVKAPINGPFDSHESTANLVCPPTTAAYFLTRSSELVTTITSLTNGRTASTTCLINGLLASSKTPLSSPNLLEKPPARTIADLSTELFLRNIQSLRLLQRFYKPLH